MLPEQIADLVAHHPLLAGLPGDAVALVAGCAQNVAVDPGSCSWPRVNRRHRLPAPPGPRGDRGARPGRDAMVIETVGPGDVVGLVVAVPSLPVAVRRPRHRVRSVRSRSTRVCLRSKAEADPDFGYALMKRVASIMLERLQATRLRLLDLYGEGLANAAQTVDLGTDRGPMTATVAHARKLIRERCSPTCTGSSTGESRPATSSRCPWSRSRARDPRSAPGQFNMLTAFGVGEAAISVSSAPGAPGPIEHTVRDVGAVTHALCRADIGDVVGCPGAVRHRLGT